MIDLLLVSILQAYTSIRTKKPLILPIKIIKFRTPPTFNNTKVNAVNLVGNPHLNSNQIAVLGLSQPNANFISPTASIQTLKAVPGYGSVNTSQNLNGSVNNFNYNAGFNSHFLSGQIERQNFNQHGYQTQSHNPRPNDLIRTNSFPRVSDSGNGFKEKSFKDQMGVKDYSKDRGLRYPRPDLEWEPDPIPIGFEEYRKRWSDGAIPTSKMEGWGPEPKIKFDPFLMWENPLAKNKPQSALAKYPDYHNALGGNNSIEFVNPTRNDWNETTKKSSWTSDSGRFNQISNSKIGNSSNFSLIFPSQSMVASPGLQSSELGNWGQNVHNEKITSSLNNTNTIDGFPFEYSSVAVGGWGELQSRQSWGADSVNSAKCSVESGRRDSVASNNPVGIAATIPVGNDLWSTSELNSNRRSSVASKNSTENWGGSNKTFINNRFWGMNVSSLSASPTNGPLSAPAYSSFDEEHWIPRQKILRSKHSTESLNSRHQEQLHSIQQNIQLYQQQIQKQIRAGGISNIGLPESNTGLRHRSSMQSLGGTSGQRSQWTDEPNTSQNLSWTER
ncbi:hypothetical protein HK096_003404 [Nowakowskiella sp. JEL0078]|nr:hypothetical protein HK096_003404 [Nowakowskiella sp. JEL0078]